MLTRVATLQSKPLPLRDRDLLRTRAFVDGSWVDADSGEMFPVVDPATGETIAEVPRLGAAETRRAIEAAERALPGVAREDREGARPHPAPHRRPDARERRRPRASS